MRTLAIATLIAAAAFAASAQGHPQGLPPGTAKKLAACNECGTVQDVRQEKRKGEGGAAGVVGGAVVGGLLGNQFGNGNGRALATAGGAVAGGFAGNEVQKHVTSKNVWVTRVKLKNGSVRSFEQDARPAWKAGSAVKINGQRLVQL